MTTPSEQSGHVAGGGLDLGTLDLMLEALDDFVTAELPESRMLDLDHEDLCPEDTVRAMCSEALGVQLVFVPEEYGGLGGGAFDSYRVCERMARIDLGLATSAFATFLGSDPILMGGTAGPEEGVAGAHRERGHPVRLRGDRAGGRQRPRRADHHRHARRRPTARSPATASRDASSGSATARSPTPTRSSRWLRAGRRGSSWRRVQTGFSGRAEGGQARHPALGHGRRCSSTT